MRGRMGGRGQSMPWSEECACALSDIALPACSVCQSGQIGYFQILPSRFDKHVCEQYMTWSEQYACALYWAIQHVALCGVGLTGEERETETET